MKNKIGSWLTRRWFGLSCVLVIAILLSTTGIQVLDQGSPNQVGIGIGVGEKVITLGYAVLAAGDADYTYDGVDDDVQWQAALDALPVTGGRLVNVSAVQLNFLATVTRAIPNVTIEGSGRGTYFTNDGVTDLFTAGGDNWAFYDLRTDAGDIGMGATTGWMWTNVTINATYYAYRSPYGQSVMNDVTVASLTDSGLANGRVPVAGAGGLLGDDADMTFSGTTLTVTDIAAPVGRGAVYTVAASDADAQSIAQADYVCDGVQDQVQIQAAITAAAAAGGGTVSLSNGTFNLVETEDPAGHFASVRVASNVVLEGQGWGTVVQPTLGTSVGIGIEMYNVSNSAIRNLRANGVDTNAVVQVSYTLSMEDSNNCEISNCYVDSATDDTIQVSNSIDFRVVNNTCVGAGGLGGGTESGVEVDDGSDNGIVANNTISQREVGITVTRHAAPAPLTEKIAVTGNIIGTSVGSPSTYGINISGANAAQVVENITCTSNIVTMTGAVPGIYISYANLVNCSDNFVEGGSYSYQVTDGSEDIILSGNISKDASSGLRVDASTLRVTVQGIDIYSPSGHGITVVTSAQDVILDGLQIFEAGNTGLVINGAGGNIIVTGGIFKNNSQAGAGADQGILVQDTDDVTIADCHVYDDQGAKTQNGITISGTSNYVNVYDCDLRGNRNDVNFTMAAGVNTNGKIEGNHGYIAPGEVRTVSGALTAGVANAICFAWHNPELQDILIKKVVIETTTAGGTAGSHLDGGIADDAAGTNRGVEFFDDLLLNTTQVHDSWVAGDGGTQTKWVFCQDAASVTDGWVVLQILDANAASLVGECYIEYCGR